MSSSRTRPPPARTDWRVFAESVRGIGHARARQPVEDANCWEVDFKSGCLIAAIADGSGSAKLGGLAARIAVRAATDNMLESLSDDDWDPTRMLRSALREARLAIREEATRRQTSMREFSTTLIVVVSTPTQAVVAQVGDGFAVIVDPAYNLIGFSEPQNGEFVNQTFFLTARDAVKNAVISIFEGPVAGVAILTDGLQRIALELPQREPYLPFFNGLFRTGEGTLQSATKQLTSFLNSPRLAKRTDDDVTLLIAWHDGHNKMPRRRNSRQRRRQRKVGILRRLWDRLRGR